MNLTLSAAVLALGLTASLVPSARAALLVLEHGEADEFASVAFEGTTFNAASVDEAVVTTNEAGLDTIYGAQNFHDGTFIDISFNPARQEVGTTSVQTRDDLLAVMALGTTPSLIVNLILVDTVDWCGFFTPDIVGCASANRNAIALESEAASSILGTELLAHELGHLLGLGHVSGGSNLMNSSLNGETALTLDQVATINESRFVQGADPDRLISITPIVVVPEPSAAVCLFLAGLLFTTRRRRKHR